jgi:acyl-CoA thioester hydrolase
MAKSQEINLEFWFDYPIRVHAHHTDYAGVVWHGSYLTWLEEARVEYFRNLGLDYADLVAAGYELPVVELSLRYHRALRMGEVAIVKTCLAQIKGVRMEWEYRIQSGDGSELYVTAQVTLVTIAEGKIVRRIPEVVERAIAQLP